VHKNFVGLGLIFCVLSANGQNSLEPVSNVVARIQNPNNTSDIAYLGMRCGTLYGSIAAYFETNGNASDVQTIRELRRKADGFEKVAFTLNMGVNKMSTEAIKKQGLALVRFYSNAMAEGKRLNNNAFTPFIQSDLAACKIESEGFSQMAAKIK
jgi:hypothetical protein